MTAHSECPLYRSGITRATAMELEKEMTQAQHEARKEACEGLRTAVVWMKGQYRDLGGLIAAAMEDIIDEQERVLSEICPEDLRDEREEEPIDLSGFQTVKSW